MVPSIPQTSLEVINSLHSKALVSTGNRSPSTPVEACPVVDLEMLEEQSMVIEARLMDSEVSVLTVTTIE